MVLRFPRQRRPPGAESAKSGGGEIWVSGSQNRRFWRFSLKFADMSLGAKKSKFGIFQSLIQNFIRVYPKLSWFCASPASGGIPGPNLRDLAGDKIWVSGRQALLALFTEILRYEPGSKKIKIRHFPKLISNFRQSVPETKLVLRFPR